MSYSLNPYIITADSVSDYIAWLWLYYCL